MGKPSQQHEHAHVVVGSLHGLGGVAHVLEHLGVGVGVLQGLPLELDGGQRAVDLCQLLLIPLLALQRLEGGCRRRTQTLSRPGPSGPRLTKVLPDPHRGCDSALIISST